MRRWLVRVVREAGGAAIDPETETRAQFLDRWADEMTGEAIVGRALLALIQEKAK